MGGVSEGVRDAVERDLAVGERGGGEEKSDGDGCAIVLDAVERRRGSEVKRGESEERSGFRGGDTRKEKKSSEGARLAGWVRLADLWMAVRTQDDSPSARSPFFFF